MAWPLRPLAPPQKKRTATNKKKKRLPPLSGLSTKNVFFKVGCQLKEIFLKNGIAIKEERGGGGDFLYDLEWVNKKERKCISNEKNIWQSFHLKFILFDL